MIWDPKYVAPYVMSAYLGIQHEVTPSMVFETAFLGNRGVKFRCSAGSIKLTG